MDGSFGAGQESEIPFALARPWAANGTVTVLGEIPEVEPVTEAAPEEPAGSEPEAEAKQASTIKAKKPVPTKKR